MDGEGPDDLRGSPEADGVHAVGEDVLDRLKDALAAAESSPSIPHVVVLYGESGRGKTYWVQRFFDDLAIAKPGYWTPDLTPEWPPQLVTKVNRERKQIIPTVVSPTAEPGFYWVGAGASPPEGAIQVEMASSISEQLAGQFGAISNLAARQKSLKSEVLDIALDFAIEALAPPVGLAKTIWQHAGKVAGLAASRSGLSEAPTRARRRAAHEAFRLASRVKPAPLIVALDDAPAATEESLYLLSGLISADSGGSTFEELMDDSPRRERFLPTVWEGGLPGPLLFLCTAWEHRLRGDYDDAFLTWLDELANLGAVIEWIECKQFSVEVASKLLEYAHVDPDSSRRVKVLQHLRATARSEASINPLVLMSAIGQINEGKHAMGHAWQLDDEAIAALPNVPEQHTQDRLAALKKASADGPKAHLILSLASHYAPQVPVKLVRLIGAHLSDGTSNDAARLISDHYLWLWPELIVPDDRLDISESADIDPDVQRYLQQKPLRSAELRILITSCEYFLEWCINVGLVGNLKAGQVGSITFSPLMQAARIVRGAAGLGRSDARAIASALINRNDDIPTQASVACRGFGYALGASWELDDDEILEAVKHYGDSGVSVLIARRRMRNLTNVGGECEKFLFRFASEHESLLMDLAKALQARGEIDQSIEVLEKLTSSSPEAVLLLAGVLQKKGDKVRAQQVLRSGASLFAVVAVRLAKQLSQKGQLQEAIDVLAPYSDVDQPAALLLADLYIQEDRQGRAFEVLQLGRNRFPLVAIRLARLLRETGHSEDAIQVLSPYIEVEQQAAPLQAELLLENHKPEEALSVLRTAAQRLPETSLKLARVLIQLGRPKDARDALEPYVDSLQDAAVLYGQIEIGLGRTEQAVKRLQQIASRERNVSVALARIVKWSDPELSTALLEPWAKTDGEAAAMMIRLLLRTGRVASAVDYLKGVSRGDVQGGLAIAIELVSGNNVKASSLLEQSRGASNFFLLNTVVANLVDCERLDLLKWLLNSAGTELCHRVLASYVVTYGLRLHAKGEIPDLENIVLALWNDADALRGSAVLEEILWGWIRDDDSVDPPLKDFSALSIFQTLLYICPTLPARLKKIALHKFKDIAQGFSNIYNLVLSSSPFSPVAEEILGDVMAPLMWSGGYQMDTED